MKKAAFLALAVLFASGNSHSELVGWHFKKSGIDPALTGTYRVKLLNGREVDVLPIYQMYLVHFQDYDLDTVHQINRAPKDLIVRWGRDVGKMVTPFAVAALTRE